MPQLGSSWQTVKGEDQADLPTDAKVDSSQLPLMTNENGDEVLRMYWLDAYEDHYRQPGDLAMSLSPQNLHLNQYQNQIDFTHCGFHFNEECISFLFEQASCTYLEKCGWTLLRLTSAAVSQ